MSAKLGREKGESRRVSAEPQEIDWSCGHCGCCDAQQFIRDGHYRRDLLTSWGPASDLRVPMLECQQCQHDVVSHFALLEKQQRFSHEMRNEIFNRAVIIPLMEKGIKRDISMKRERQARRSSGKEKKEVEL
ncbi:MAG TPA: hypothetical protein VGF67_23220, partial [Ktedonobacteraceae bacterium]